MTTKSVVITEIDFDRLNALIDSPRYRVTHAALLDNLRGELARGKVVGPTRVPSSVVTMNSRVRVRDLKTDEVDEYALCYPEQADIAAGRLSVLAPLGTALLGTRVGSVIEFKAPAGVRRLRVEASLFQPEREGQFHL